MNSLFVLKFKSGYFLHIDFFLILKVYASWILEVGHSKKIKI